MAVWQIMKEGLPTEAPNFDDGAQVEPGHPEFSTDAVGAHVESLGNAADGFNYVGHSPAPPTTE